MMDLKDQYKHPLWQKKRLEALEYYGFFCQSCESTEKQLHVHHRSYVKGRMIWEYTAEELDVLCCDCHKSVHEEKDLFNSIITKAEFISYMDLSALVYNFLNPSNPPDEDETQEGLRLFNPALVEIGNFARNSCDFNPSDIREILRLNPDDFSKLAEIARNM